MAEALPRLIVTGASGIVGRSFLETARDRFRIFAVARRPQQQSGVPHHPNIHWLQVDIGNREALATVMGHIRDEGGADFVLHLAAHYDFENVELSAYQRTNVEGTRNMLEHARSLGVSHFVFASSVAACEFPAPGGAVNEDSPPDANFPYARSKRAGERMMSEYASSFTCSTVRLAAVFSDWCEYAPLYKLLSMWLSRSPLARVLGGRGLTAVPYIHTHDLSRLFLLLLARTGELPSPRTYVASPDGATTHRELFELATRFQFRRSFRPVLLPRPLAAAAVLVRELAGGLVGRRPFERLWMVGYLDRVLTIDASRTRRELGWDTTPRYRILRRLLFIVAKMRGNPQEWILRNERAMKRPLARPALVIHDAMVEARDAIVDAIVAYLQSPVRNERFPNYAGMTYQELQWSIGIVLDLLAAAVRTGDRELVLQYARDLARRRLAAGFPPAELCDALLAINEVAVEQLLYKPAVAEFAEEVRDSVTLSLALAADVVQDTFASFRDETPGAAPPLDPEKTDEDVERIIEKLNAFYRP